MRLLFNWGLVLAMMVLISLIKLRADLFCNSVHLVSYIINNRLMTNHNPNGSHCYLRWAKRKNESAEIHRSLPRGFLLKTVLLAILNNNLVTSSWDEFMARRGVVFCVSLSTYVCTAYANILFIRLY